MTTTTPATASQQAPVKKKRLTTSAMIASKRAIRWRSWAAIDSYSEQRRWRSASRSGAS